MIWEFLMYQVAFWLAIAALLAMLIQDDLARHTGNPKAIPDRFVLGLVVLLALPPSLAINLASEGGLLIIPGAVIMFAWANYMYYSKVLDSLAIVAFVLHSQSHTTDRVA